MTITQKGCRHSILAKLHHRNISQIQENLPNAFIQCQKHLDSPQQKS